MNAPFSKWQVFANYSGLKDWNSAIADNQFAATGKLARFQRAAVPREALAIEMMNTGCVASAIRGSRKITA